MSIPHGLLALLRQGPMYGYQLRSEFERATGSTWPLNVGQVYTTLTRLERDGLVRALDTDDGDRQRYSVTEAGTAAVDDWFTKPVTLEDRPRDELAIKLALAAVTPDLDVAAIVLVQRTSTMRRLQELTRLKRDEPTSDDELAWSLVLDNLRFMAEAELRWLDHCEGTLARTRRRPPATDPSTTAPAADLEKESLR